MNLKTPLCIDVSGWQGAITWPQVTPKPVLAFCKATEGDFFADATFAPNMSGMQANGIRRGVYHFHRKAVAESKQAAWFITHVDGILRPGDFIALDVEEGGETATQIIDWIDRVEAVYPQNQILIYSRKNILDPISAFLNWFGAKRQPQSALDMMSMTNAQAERLKQYPTWIAGYPSNPDLYNSIPSFYIPDQTRWGPPWLWQYSDKGALPGINSNSVDLSWMSSEIIRVISNAVPPADTVTRPFDGVQTITGERYGWTFWLDIFDTAKVRYEVVHPNPLDVGTNVAKAKGASHVYNGGEWDRIAMPKDYSVANGYVYVQRKQAVPSLMILQNSQAVIDHKNASNVQQAISGLRYIVQDGVLPAYLFNSDPQYTEGHARAIDGLTADGRHMRLTSEGVYPNQGLTLAQAARIMVQYGAVIAHDEGGGGDVTRVVKGLLTNTPENIVLGVNVQRYLPQFLIVYAKEQSMPNTNGKATELLGNIGTIRKAPSRYGADTGKRVSPYATIEFTAIVPVTVGGSADNPEDQWFQLPDGTYLNYMLNGRQYFNVDSMPSDGTTSTTLADMPFTITLGDDVTYVKQVITGVVKAK